MNGGIKTVGQGATSLSWAYMTRSVMEVCEFGNEMFDILLSLGECGDHGGGLLVGLKKDRDSEVDTGEVETSELLPAVGEGVDLPCGSAHAMMSFMAGEGGCHSGGGGDGV